jgi:hypothetical protein
MKNWRVHVQSTERKRKEHYEVIKIRNQKGSEGGVLKGS